MTNAEAIETLRANYPDACYEQLREAVDAAIEVLKAQGVAGDLISRQAAINEIMALIEEPDNDFNEGVRTSACVIDKLPSAQLERKRGEWIERNPQNSDKCRLIECDQCGFSHIVGFNVPYEHWIENRNFCERCGADMREVDDESNQ